MKKLSAIIPCRHQAKFLPGLVTDLKRELGQEIEIIVVEDASNEDSVYEVALPAERDL
jgi:glycosyltransferase involved in cell wall biosynthesis